MKTEELQYLVDSSKGLVRHTWVPDLPNLFANHGLWQITQNHYPTPPELLIPMTQTHFMFGSEMSSITMDNSDSDKGGPAYRRRIEEAAREAKEGAAMTFTLEVTVGMRSS